MDKAAPVFKFFSRDVSLDILNVSLVPWTQSVYQYSDNFVCRALLDLGETLRALLYKGGEHPAQSLKDAHFGAGDVLGNIFSWFYVCSHSGLTLPVGMAQRYGQGCCLQSFLYFHFVCLIPFLKVRRLCWNTDAPFLGWLGNRDLPFCLCLSGWNILLNVFKLKSVLPSFKQHSCGEIFGMLC